MSNSIPSVPLPKNEPVKSYAPGSPERAELKAQLDALIKEPLEIPLFIGGGEVRTGNVVELTAPHDKSLVIARVHKGGPDEIQAAMKDLPVDGDASVLLKQALQRLAVNS